MSCRTAAKIGLIAQIVFCLGWLVAPIWQGQKYSPLAHTISDMYAVTAPYGWVLVILITLCGLATATFIFFGLWPHFRGQGSLGLFGILLLGLSIFSLGDSLTPFERMACRLADSECTPDSQTANLGGTLDAVLSSVGVVAFMISCFILAAALTKIPHWKPLAWPARITGVVIALAMFAIAPTQEIGLGGLMERIVALVGAAALAAVALRVMRLPEPQPASGLV